MLKSWYDATMGSDLLRVQEEFQQVVSAVEEIVRLSSRWNGTIKLVSKQEVDLLSRQPYLAKKEWNCSMTVLEEYVDRDERWRIYIHEALHSVSEGISPEAYTRFRGWEEGVVEWLQRHYRVDILKGMNVAVSERVFEQSESAWLYNSAIKALQEIASQLPNISDEEFFMRLIHTSLKDRMSFTQMWGMQTAINKNDFLRVFAVSSGILRR